MGDVTTHHDVVFFDHCNSTHLVVIVVLVVLYTCLVVLVRRPPVVLLGLDDVTTKHLGVLYFNLGVVENIIIIIYIFYYFYWLLLTLLFWLGRSAPSLVSACHVMRLTAEPPSLAVLLLRSFHYEFNIRHLAGVFQGMLMSKPDQVNEPMKLVQLWLHESERVYSDRLATTADQKKYKELALEQAKKCFSCLSVTL